MSRAYRIYLLPAFALVLTMLFGCGADGDSVATEVDPAGWDRTNPAQVIFNNTDTLSKRDITVFIVCNGVFSGQRDSLEVAVTTITPDSLRTTETAVLYPAAPVGTARYRQFTRFYRYDVILYEKGEYRFIFSHDLSAPVRGVKAIGITVGPTTE